MEARVDGNNNLADVCAHRSLTGFVNGYRVVVVKLMGEREREREGKVKGNKKERRKVEKERRKVKKLK